MIAHLLHRLWTHIAFRRADRGDGPGTKRALDRAAWWLLRAKGGR